MEVSRTGIKLLQAEKRLDTACKVLEDLMGLGEQRHLKKQGVSTLANNEGVSGSCARF